MCVSLVAAIADGLIRFESGRSSHPLVGDRPEGAIRLGGFSRSSPCVPNDQRSTSHLYRLKEQIVKSWRREIDDWKDESGQKWLLKTPFDVKINKLR
jgi:hypothetical protein